MTDPVEKLYWFTCLFFYQEYDVAQKFIAAATEDLKKHQFTQLLSWESLYVTIVEKLDVWPNNTDGELSIS